MSGDFEIERRCSHEKKPGIVHLSPTHLSWSPDSAADGKGMQVAFTSIRQFQVSKEGSAKKAMIRLTCNDNAAKITLDFGRSFSDRDAVRDVLNKMQAKGASALAAGVQPAAPAAQNGNSDSSARAPPVPPPKPIPPEEQARRRKLLGRKEVLKLHHKLVRGGAVSDEQFWNGMKYRYKANGEKRSVRSGAADLEEEDESAGRETTRGVPSDAFTAGANCAGDATVWEHAIPTAAQRHVVFMEHPSVARALSAKVPSEMSEERFWTLYAQSSLAPRRRGRGPAGRPTKTETVATAEADAVFAAFQAREGEEKARETRKRVHGLATELALDRFDDHRTAHVLEGHVVGGEAPRPMKRARGGGLPASSNLRLMRQLNEHGALVVGKGDGNWTEGEAEKGRPLDDLEVEAGPRFARLGVAEEGRAGRAAERAEVAGGAEIVAAMRREVDEWRVNVKRLEREVAGSSAVLRSLLGRMRP